MDQALWPGAGTLQLAKHGLSVQPWSWEETQLHMIKPTDSGEGFPKGKPEAMAKEVEWVVGRQSHQVLPTSARGGRRGEAGEGGIGACFPRRQSVHEKFLSREISLLRAGSELAADRCPVSCRFSTLGGKVAVFSLPWLFLWPLGRGSGPERGLPKASRALGGRGLTSCRSFTALVQVDFVLFYFLNLKNVYLLSHITNH